MHFKIITDPTHRPVLQEVRKHMADKGFIAELERLQKLLVARLWGVNPLMIHQLKNPQMTKRVENHGSVWASWRPWLLLGHLGSQTSFQTIFGVSMGGFAMIYPGSCPQTSPKSQLVSWSLETLEKMFNWGIGKPGVKTW